MVTLTNIAKTAVSTLTNATKPSTGSASYLLREEGSYLLREESNRLILSEGFTFINQAKS